MTRRKHRETVFITAFEESFGYNTLEDIKENNAEEGEWILEGYGEELFAAYHDHLMEVDSLIEPKLTDWTMSRIPKVCLILLRIAVTEMMFIDTVGDSVAINEAVELTKKYAAPEDYQFVNGILGNISREQHPEENKAKE